MIPELFVQEWKAHAPWPTDAMVEQDLIICRSLVAIFSHPVLSRQLTFRGGTALHKLHLAPPSRYSEDIDLVQIANHPKSDFVFPNGDGTPYDRSALRIRLARVCRRANIPVRPPYAWRHFFGTMQGVNGTNLAIIAQLMGHSTIQMSCRYISNSDEAHLKAVAIMEKYV